MKGSYLFYFLLFTISFLSVKKSFGQEVISVKPDTIKIREIKPRSSKIYDPDRAALLSAVVPGMGQVYNKQSWKVPFIYAGIGVLYYYFDLNNKSFKSFRNAGINLRNPNANLAIDARSAKLLRGVTITPGLLQRGEEEYRRRRDLTIILACASYGMIIVDAYVNAHLKGFTISKDLSFKVKPSIEPTLMSGSSSGIAFNLTFK